MATDLPGDHPPVEPLVDLAFVKAHPSGVTWDCSVCDVLRLNETSALLSSEASAGAIDSHSGAAAVALARTLAAAVEQQQLCATCKGYPAGHPECLGARWAQRFRAVPELSIVVGPRDGTRGGVMLCAYVPVCSWVCLLL